MNDETKNYTYDVTITPQPNSTVEISGEIPYADLDAEREKAVRHLSKGLKLDGFRDGHVPEKVIIEKRGEMALLSEMAEHALRKAYPAIILERNLDVIGYPEISITKLAKDNPLGFKAVVAVVPEVTLPDYKAIAKEKNVARESDEVTDDEVEEQIKDILRQKVAYERLQQKAVAKSEAEGNTDGTADLPTPESVAAKEEDAVDPKDLPLPELTDEYVKGLGQPGQFENVADFKAKIREHLAIQKKEDVAAKHRANITDAIIEQTNCEVPKVMVDAELNQMFAQMNEDLTRAGLTMESYLEHIKKSQEDLEAEWRPSAEKRAKLQLVLNEIAKQENVTPDSEKLEHEVGHILEHHKDADESRVRTYVATVLQNGAVMELLESI